MRVAILSAGPSLRETYRPGGHDLLITINTAASMYDAPWWCCADEWRFKDIEPIGTPRLFTMGTERDKMLVTCPKKVERHIVTPWSEVVEDLARQGRQVPPGAISWSCPTALTLAVWLGAKSIDVYGADMNGERDCNDQYLINRKPERWTREVDQAWKPLVKWCAAQGAPVTRYTNGKSLVLPGDVLIPEPVEV